jgi:glycosyltransferase involved in cell wall biosynthesis
LQKVNTKQILVRATEYDLSSTKLSSFDGKLHFGVLGNNQFRKNIHNQLAGALMVDNSIIHCSAIFEFEYLNASNRIKFNSSYMPHSEYLKLLGSMDVNSYVSFSESWGQIIPESLMMGVPCLAANNASIFDFNEELADLLVVKEFDNSAAIAEQIKRILPYKEEIGRKGREYVLKLNSMADERIKEWLDD